MADASRPVAWEVGFQFGYPDMDWKKIVLDLPKEVVGAWMKAQGIPWNFPDREPLMNKIAVIIQHQATSKGVITLALYAHDNAYQLISRLDSFHD